MPIMRGNVDVTEEVEAHVEALRRGPRGQRQRDALYGILTKAIISINEISVPWMDDCIYETKASLEELRDAISRNVS